MVHTEWIRSRLYEQLKIIFHGEISLGTCVNFARNEYSLRKYFTRRIKYRIDLFFNFERSIEIRKNPKSRFFFADKFPSNFCVVPEHYDFQKLIITGQDNSFSRPNSCKIYLPKVTNRNFFLKKFVKSRKKYYLKKQKTPFLHKVL